MVNISLFSHLHTDMGEKIYLQKFSPHLPTATMQDIPSLLGEDYSSLVALNLELASMGYEPLASPFHIYPDMKKGVAIILSWTSGMAAMHATGIVDQVPTIAKLYAHHSNEKMLPSLYNKTKLLITESLLASERARAYGLNRVLYIPHQFTTTDITPSKYLCELAKRLNKPLPSQAIVVGTVSRLEYWKNPEFAIEVVRQLQPYYPMVLVLKGDFPQQSVYPDYEKNLAEMIEFYSQEPWFYWDRQWTPYPDVLAQYACFDICLQPSGAEGASNLVVELMAMGKPVIVLNATSHPYLFKEGVHFATAQPQLQMAQLSYARPELESLKEALVRLCHPKERAQLGQKAQMIAKERFDPKHARERIKLMMQLVENDETIEHIEKEDRRKYGL